ncbi:hypothetical protein FKR81_08985 [Lentzea tibetensis]|uniref:Prenyltransferase n=1 Tax=Lentzea tibetensis TaxID=2591470 RepID=A0A563EXJ1_9PSEU|nr:hypothetical protein [Lentzea tibetensis]TWP52457.1 hypothetical protein FKR81_08985 [Lentzea tibetensis]
MIERARSFIWHNARVLEQRRFEFLFDGGPAEPVVTALLAYRNDDGGFGHALEPDGRGPTSQPLHVLSALHLLGELNAPEHVPPVLGFLGEIWNDGVPFGLTTGAKYPHAPWIEMDGRGGLLLTGQIVSALHRMKIEHPWVDRATEYCWQQIEDLTSAHPYEANACVMFLDQVPDRERAEKHAERLGTIVKEQLVTGGLDAAEVHKPHDYASRPDSLARRWFSDEEFAKSLDELVAAQQEDGGWDFPWAAWTPVTKFEWRPIVTIENLVKLRAHGRIS